LELSENVERQRKERDVKKQPGRTWIEVNDVVHTFVVDVQIHPQMIKIRAELKRLSVLMHDAGYVPNMKFVLHDVEEEEILEAFSPPQSISTIKQVPQGYILSFNQINHGCLMYAIVVVLIMFNGGGQMG
jgi:hypothetical protein